MQVNFTTFYNVITFGAYGFTLYMLIRMYCRRLGITNYRLNITISKEPSASPKNISDSTKVELQKINQEQILNKISRPFPNPKKTVVYEVDQVIAFGEDDFYFPNQIELEPEHEDEEILTSQQVSKQDGSNIESNMITGGDGKDKFPEFSSEYTYFSMYHSTILLFVNQYFTESSWIEEIDLMMEDIAMIIDEYISTLSEIVLPDLRSLMLQMARKRLIELKSKVIIINRLNEADKKELAARKYQDQQKKESSIQEKKRIETDLKLINERNKPSIPIVIEVDKKEKANNLLNSLRANKSSNHK